MGETKTITYSQTTDYGKVRPYFLGRTSTILCCRQSNAHRQSLYRTSFRGNLLSNQPLTSAMQWPVEARLAQQLLNLIVMDFVKVDNHD